MKNMLGKVSILSRNGLLVSPLLKRKTDVRLKVLKTVFYLNVRHVRPVCTSVYVFP